LTKNSKKNNGNNFTGQVKIFIKWGIYGGLLIPFASMFIILLLPNFTNPVVESMEIWVMAIMVGYIFATYFIAYHILAYYGDKDAQSNRRNSIGGALLPGLGILSLIVLYLLVLWTGGLNISPFSGYFIYTPVVVFLVFKQQFNKVLIAGIVAIIFAVLSTPIIVNFIINLVIRSEVNFIKNLVIRFHPSTLKSVTPWIVTAEYQLHYMIVVITQVTASILVAHISGSSNPLENDDDSAAPPEK